jgi:GT2 family glycosyltransferase/SAM-dependent methyltransferase
VCNPSTLLGTQLSGDLQSASVAQMNQMTEIDVSIVIPNWNGLGIVDRCLSSIFDNPQGTSFEVIVVDNGSSDESVDTIRRLFPLVTIARRAFNTGFARACNAGMRLARGRFIWVLNADTEISSYALREMVRFMEAHAEVGALNPRVIYPDGTLQPAVRRVPTLRSAVWEEVFWGTPLHGLFGRDRKHKAWESDIDYDDVVEMEWLRGSCLLIRRDIYNQVGEFDEVFFFGYEEIDYCMRIRAAGWKLVWMPLVTIVHKSSSLGSKFGPTLMLWLNYSKFKFWRKKNGRLGEMTIRLCVAGLNTVAFLVNCIRRLLGRTPVKGRGLGFYIELIRGALSGFPGWPDGWDASVWQRIQAGHDWGSHGFLLAMIPQGLRLLDLGCNDGGLTRKLAQAGASQVVALDIRLPAVTDASTNHDTTNVSYLVADTERLPFADSAGAEFDGVVFADVLEHLNNPGRVLKELSDMFVSGGRLRRAYVCLPNVAYWRIRRGLALGDFEYQDRGIMDRTHRWFFTKGTAERMLSENGWVILRVLPIPGFKAAGLRGRISVRLARSFPTLFAYQFVFECCPDQFSVFIPQDELWKSRELSSASLTAQRCIQQL